MTTQANHLKFYQSCSNCEVTDCHLTAKMTCGLKALTLADSEVLYLLECHKFESVDSGVTGVN